MRCRVKQAKKHGDAAGGVFDIDQNGDKFVTPEARQSVAFAHAVFHAFGQRDQQPVTGLMAGVVVNKFESVNVNRPPPAIAYAGLPGPLPGADGLPAAHGWGKVVNTS